MTGDVVELEASLCDAALSYARRGWPVFPCSPANKRPLVGESEPGKGDGGLYQATTDEAKIRGWWARWPDAMIGVPTGATIGYFVVDLDPKPGTTIDQLLEDLRRRCGGKLPACPITRTPRGGVHLWFAMPAGIEIGNRGGFLPMCDVRGTGGYVILPPSQRKGAAAEKDGCEGKVYDWEEDASLDEFSPPEAPAALVLMIVSRNEREAGERPEQEERPRLAARAAPADAAGARERRYALAAFDEEIRAVQTAGKGTRNTALNNAALKLASLVAAGALSESLVHAALEDAAALSGLVKDDGLRSVRATIASGFKAGLAKPRDLSAMIEPQARTPSAPARDPRPPERTA